MFKTEKEFLEAYEEAFRKYRIEYHVQFSHADRELGDLFKLGLKRFGYDAMMFRLEKELDEIKARVSREIPI